MNRLATVTILLLISSTLCAQIIINVEDRRADHADSTGWYESLDVSGSLVQNTQQVLSLEGSLQLEFQGNKRRFLSLSSFKFLRAAGQSFVNQGAQHMRYTIDVNKVYDHEIFGQLQYNENILIKIRALIGTGPRFKLVESDTKKLYYGIAYMYEYNEETDARIIYRDHRISTYLSFDFTLGDLVSLSGTSYYQPIITDPDVFRLSSRSTLTFRFSRQLSFKSSFQITYDDRSREGVPKTTYSWMNGIRYRF